MNNTQGSNRILIYGLVLVCSVFWGFSFLATSILVKTLDPIQIQAARWLIAAAFYGVMIALGYIRIDLSKNRRWLLLLCGLSQPCFYMIFETYGIKMTSASVGSIFIATIPCAVLIIESLVFGNKTSRNGIISILLAFSGVAVCTVFSPAFSIGGSATGYLFMLGAVLMGGIYSVISHKAGADYSSLEITASMAIIGCVFFNTLNWVMGYGLSTYSAITGDARLLIGIVFLGVCCSAICYLAFNKSILLINPALANNMNASMTTVVGALAGILIGGDPGGIYTIIGLAMTIAGVILSSREIS